VSRAPVILTGVVEKGEGWGARGSATPVKKIKGGLAA